MKIKVTSGVLGKDGKPFAPCSLTVEYANGMCSPADYTIENVLSLINVLHDDEQADGVVGFSVTDKSNRECTYTR